MRKTSSRITAAFVSVFSFALAAAANEAPVFDVIRLTDNVTVFTERSPWRSNHVAIATDRGLVVVDPGGSPVVGRLLRRAIEDELGRREVAYVVNHHHHWGHSWGNVAFPEAVVVGHEAAVAAMQATSQFVEPRLARFRVQLEDAEGEPEQLDPESVEAREAAASRRQAEWLVDGLTEPGFEVRVPDLTFSERLVLDLGNVTLQFHHLGRGHSETDAVVFIPEDGVLLLGCFFLLMDDLPVFGFQSQLDVDRWLEVFETILEGDVPVRTVVPGQHDLWSPERLRGWRDYISRLWSDVRELEADGPTLAEAQRRLVMPESTAALVDASVTEEALRDYQLANVERLWRQLKENGAVAVGRALDDEGIAAALALYDILRGKPAGEVYFSEAEFNVLGYQLMGEGRYEEARAIFELNVEAYPESWNVYDSLGEAHMMMGDEERAVELYRRSLELNPDNTNAVTMLQRMGFGP